MLAQQQLPLLTLPAALQPQPGCGSFRLGTSLTVCTSCCLLPWPHRSFLSGTSHLHLQLLFALFVSLCAGCRRGPVPSGLLALPRGAPHVSRHNRLQATFQPTRCRSSSRATASSCSPPSWSTSLARARPTPMCTTRSVRGLGALCLLHLCKPCLLPVARAAVAAACKVVDAQVPQQRVLRNMHSSGGCMQGGGCMGASNRW